MIIVITLNLYSFASIITIHNNIISENFVTLSLAIINWVEQIPGYTLTYIQYWLYRYVSAKVNIR